MITPDLFGDDAIAPPTRAFLAMFDKATQGVPTAVNTPLQVLREARAKGSAALPIVKLEGAREHTIAGPGGAITLRSFTPEAPRGAYLHFHGGGFVMGAPDQQDTMLDLFARERGLAVVSASYRLAPEHPFPAAPDDCLAAALWVIEQHRAGRFGDGPLFIGGESAGAYLVATTLLRLREQGLVSAFRGAVLNFGVFDLSLTPSARQWGGRYAIISTPIMRKYVEAFAPDTPDAAALQAPALSPLYADLKGLPPALFTVGTQDPLLDDSLLMAQRWTAAGNRAELAVYPGGIHAFFAFPIPIANEALARQLAFLQALQGT